MMRARRQDGGFTLLEVLVAVSILGLGLTAILSAQAGAFATAAAARNISVATSLVRCKMSEVEEHLYKDGFQETDESGSGPCCEGDENPNFRCAWRADRPTFPEARFGELNLDSALNLGGSSGPGGPAGGGLGALGLLSGAGAGSSPLGGVSSLGDAAKMLGDANSAAAAGVTPPAPSAGASSAGDPSASPPGDPGSGMGGIASLAMSFVYPSLKLVFEASTRRITATVIYREGQKERTIEVVEWFTAPQKGLTVDDQSAVDPTSGLTSPTPTPKPKP